VRQVNAFGYRYGEVPLPKLPETKDTYRVSKTRPVDIKSRPVVLSSLGCHVAGATMPHGDPQDPMTMKAGVAKRAGSKTPQFDSNRLAKFRLFVRNFVGTHLKPLRSDADTSVEAWLQKTDYPQHRRVELLEKWNRIQGKIRPKHRKCKCFMKDESYPDYKHVRGIYSRSDEFKCRAGPIFKLIEEEVYKLPQFIKHVPVKDRPAYIKEMLYRFTGKYVATDYTTFEASFVKEIMDSCEFELYSYMTSVLPDGPDWLEEMRSTLMGMNHCDFKNFWMELDSTRMSGEMCTSLGNGFTNLMVMMFLCEELGSKVVGVVEGDDGLFRILGLLPTSSDFASLGFTIKLEEHSDLCSASFCGIIFHPDECINVTDPAKVLCSFGWTTNRYAKCRPRRKLELLRCKALSYAWQYPGCPIIQSLAHYGLRMTKNLRNDEMKTFVEKKLVADVYQRRHLIMVVNDEVQFKPVGIKTRMLVASKYGISVEMQILIEKYLDEKSDLTHLDIPGIELLVPRSWIHYWNHYVYPTSLVESGSIPFPTMAGFISEIL